MVMAGVMIPGITIPGIIHGILLTGIVLIVLAGASAGAVFMPAGILRGMTIGVRLTDGDMVITEAIMAVITGIITITTITAGHIIETNTDVRQRVPVREDVTRTVIALQAHPVQPYRVAVRVLQKAEVHPSAVPVVIQGAALL